MLALKWMMAKNPLPYGLQAMRYTTRNVELYGRIGRDYVVKSPISDRKIPEKSLVKFVFDRFDYFQKQIALVDGITGLEVSYAQLRDDCARVSSGLRRMGLQKGDTLALCAPNSIDYVKMFFATIALGGVITTCNPTFTPRELQYQFKNSRAKYVATVPELLLTVQEATAVNTDVKRIIILDHSRNSSDDRSLVSIQSLFEDSGSLFEIESVNCKEDTAVLPYSSGTTGMPKGVMLTHHNLVANCCQLDHPHAQGLVNGETILGILPFFHIYGMVVILIHGLYKGVKQVILPKFEPQSFLTSIEKYQIHSANLVPPLILFFSKHDDVEKYDLSSLKNVTSGAAPLGSEIVQTACSRTGIRIIRQGYGLTETSPVTHLKPLQMGMEKPRSIGPPLPNQDCKVVSINNNMTLGPGEEGEIFISGPNVMKGYLHKPEETRKCIDKEGWFHTGDIGYFDKEGHFYITDRLKELIKVKGLQVAPAELEALLLCHPDVLDAAVIGVPNQLLGEAPKAFIVRKTSGLKERDIVQFVERNISKHKWLAGGVEFIQLIPKSASGKILRRSLKKINGQHT